MSTAPSTVVGRAVARGRRRNPVCAREFVWPQSLAPSPQVQLHRPHPPSSIPPPQILVVDGEMLRAQKDAAAATRELLKADGTRMRKAAQASAQKGTSSASAWKEPVAQIRKAHAGAAAARVQGRSAAEQRSLPPEQNGMGGFGGATSPASFTDRTCFFNGSLFGGSSQSPMAQAWMHSQVSYTGSW
ncbi:hypothetical protein PVAP13_6NG087900 [Panicum virgatum]|uniref:Uncharacterized protein n=2 Tax=Panicum virgatum TaxID=38727 RepID=A0A8T0QVZ0_PANVG|nr:hypothetical protein PVAP13_6NG087900 [Panicum virgatum]